MSCKHRNVHCPDMERSLRRIYQELQSLHVKYVGVRVKYCLCWPAPINGMWEKGRAGEGFLGGGRDWHMSPGVHVRAKVCCGLCPSRAGHGECSWECCTHGQCSVPPGDFHSPLPQERCAATPTEPERSWWAPRGCAASSPCQVTTCQSLDKCRPVAE